MSKDLPLDKINKLSEVLKEQGLTEIEIESGELKIRVRKEGAPIVSSIAAPAAAAPTSSNGAPAAPANDGLTEIKSPMVGTYYASPSPDAEPFIKVGSKINKGDTICIIEAMKIMNELPAEVSGEVVEICVNNADAVSFGQVIVKVK